MMGLRGVALEVATHILSRFPRAKLTSGRRDVHDQATAMATNTMKDKTFIRSTYRPSKASELCAAWVEKRTTLNFMDTARAFNVILSHLPDAELAKLSKHLSGDAFDIQPIDGPDGDAIKAALYDAAKTHKGKFLEREGNLVRWHWQGP